MKFSIEIDDESINEDNIKHEVAQILSQKVYSSLNLDWIKKQANDELEKKKKLCLDGVKVTVESWDKAEIVFQLQAMLEKKWIDQISEKVVDKLKHSSDFISRVSAEIIKSKFN